MYYIYIWSTGPLFCPQPPTQMVINEVMKLSCNFNKLEQRMRSLYTCLSSFFPLVLFSWVSVAVLSTSANDILLRIAPRALTPNMRIVLALDFFLDFFFEKSRPGVGELAQAWILPSFCGVIPKHFSNIAMAAFIRIMMPCARYKLDPTFCNGHRQRM